MRAFVICVLGLFLGIGIGWFLLTYTPHFVLQVRKMVFPTKQESFSSEKQIIGFLPYWLVSSAKPDYANTITTFTYFGLTVGPDGKIQYLLNEQEEEPGYHMLKSEKLKAMLTSAKKNDQILSLLVFSADTDAIYSLISNPKDHAKNLVDDVESIMKKYGFTDLNLDIESIGFASDSARENFTHFVSEVQKEVKKKKLGTVTIEITGSDLIKKNLLNPKDIAPIADYVVIMAYDFHYQGSAVSGPVAPIGGAQDEAEFDTNVVLSQAYKVIPREKIVLGVPTYGYSWETLEKTQASATLPGSGTTRSGKNAEVFLKSCASCSAMLDEKAKENYVIYKDEQTGMYHQMYFHTAQTMQEKVSLVTSNNLAGIAIWALGYEDSRILEPIAGYKKDIIDIIRL